MRILFTIFVAIGCRAVDGASDTADTVTETATKTATETSESVDSATETASQTAYADTGAESDISPLGSNVFCGDGRRQSSEKCDDDNNTDGDGCSRSCEIEDSYLCTGILGRASHCFVCGDGDFEGRTEECDDGNMLDGDGCSAACTVEKDWECGPPYYCYRPDRCGDGVLDLWECCEDGNRESGDGCSERCQVEPGRLSDNVQTQACIPMNCGNGVIEPGETCDFGTEENNGSYGRCSEDCYWADYCGDGVLQAYMEDCDDGNFLNYDACPASCRSLEDG